MSPLHWLLLGVCGLVLAGCARQAADLSADEDQRLRDNLTRALTPEEIAQMGAGGEQGGAAERPGRN